ncbi:MAG TPA: sigma factor-like helix-turn-helix DNA-binding protein [Nocardia sp.]|uniref:sigma factor-like helix-turn-helix DNA-binding protein n=1 Tax=Nocardia TaxID=1817 RepID=UPI0024541963|nr:MULTISPECIES: sigma factor-like helix-turn-helix DNA-binding protein [Nocardia]HLS79754.1 sigma factor-like helix-turn-helix DNA-binding protein [Nocardia sp.]
MPSTSASTCATTPSRYSSRGETYDDLYRVAGLAVALAIDSFDPAQGKPFVAFVVPEVLGAVRRRAGERAWGARIAQHIQEIRAQITATVDALTDRLSRVPTATEIAVELDVEVHDVRRALLAHRGADLAGGAGAVLDADPGEPGYELVMGEVVASRVLAALSETERWVLYLRFFRGQPVARIAAQLGVSPMGVSHLLGDALATVREVTRPG